MKSRFSTKQDGICHNITEMIGEIEFVFVFGSIWKHLQGSIDNFQNFIL